MTTGRHSDVAGELGANIGELVRRELRIAARAGDDLSAATSQFRGPAEHSFRAARVRAAVRDESHRTPSQKLRPRGPYRI